MNGLKSGERARILAEAMQAMKEARLLWESVSGKYGISDGGRLDDCLVKCRSALRTLLCDEERRAGIVGEGGTVSVYMTGNGKTEVFEMTVRSAGDKKIVCGAPPRELEDVFPAGIIFLPFSQIWGMPCGEDARRGRPVCLYRYGEINPDLKSADRFMETLGVRSEVLVLPGAADETLDAAESIFRAYEDERARLLCERARQAGKNEVKNMIVLLLGRTRGFSREDIAASAGEEDAKPCGMPEEGR